MLKCIDRQSGESVEPVVKKKANASVEWFAEKEGFKPGMKVGGDGWWLIVAGRLRLISVPRDFDRLRLLSGMPPDDCGPPRTVHKH